MPCVRHGRNGKSMMVLACAADDEAVSWAMNVIQGTATGTPV
jgi:hypothetical protein